MAKAHPEQLEHQNLSIDDNRIFYAGAIEV